MLKILWVRHGTACAMLVLALISICCFTHLGAPDYAHIDDKKSPGSSGNPRLSQVMALGVAPQASIETLESIGSGTVMSGGVIEGPGSSGYPRLPQVMALGVAPQARIETLESVGSGTVTGGG